MSESTFLAWMHTYSTDGPSSESAVESFEGSEAKIGDGVETISVAGVELSTTRKRMLATAVAEAQKTLDEIAYKNAGVNRVHLDRLQEKIQSKLSSSDDWPDKVKDLSELVSGLTAKENASKALKNVSESRKPVVDVGVDPDGHRGVAAGDFQFDVEAQNEAGIFKLKVYDVKLATDNEYSIVFVQAEQFQRGKYRSIGDYFTVLHRSMPEAGVCIFNCPSFLFSRRVFVTVRPIAVSLPSVLNALSECFEVKEHLDQANEIIHRIIEEKNASKKKLLDKNIKLRIVSEEKDRKLEAAYGEIEVLKQQLTDWQEEVIGISERIKQKAMPATRRMIYRSGLSATSMSNYSDFETIQSPSDSTMAVFETVQSSSDSTMAVFEAVQSPSDSTMAAFETVRSPSDSTITVFETIQSPSDSTMAVFDTV